MKEHFKIIDSKSFPGGSNSIIKIPLECPFFKGHFPGNPTLPAVAHLTILTQIHRLNSGNNITISIVKYIRVYQPIEPGEIISINISEKKKNTTQFRFHKEGKMVSQGTVNWNVNEK